MSKEGTKTLTKPSPKEKKQIAEVAKNGEVAREDIKTIKTIVMDLKNCVHIDANSTPADYGVGELSPGQFNVMYDDSTNILHFVHVDTVKNIVTSSFDCFKYSFEKML